MFGRFAHILLALMIALAAVMPAGARAVPPAGGLGGTTLQLHSRTYPAHHSADTHSEKKQACSIVACTGAVATLPTPARLPERISLQTAYLSASSVRWTAAVSAPDPFPPRARVFD